MKMDPPVEHFKKLRNLYHLSSILNEIQKTHIGNRRIIIVSTQYFSISNLWNHCLKFVWDLQYYFEMSHSYEISRWWFVISRWYLISRCNKTSTTIGLWNWQVSNVLIICCSRSNHFSNWKCFTCFKELKFLIAIQLVNGINYKLKSSYAFFGYAHRSIKQGSVYNVWLDRNYMSNFAKCGID